MIIAAALLLVLGALCYTLLVRNKDIPLPIPISPVQHLEDRKRAIYDNLRDLQFEYRLGKLSDRDYQHTKLALQKELAVVLAATEETIARLGTADVRVRMRAKPAPTTSKARPVCPRCGTSFQQALKFCGECGTAIA